MNQSLVSVNEVPFAVILTKEYIYLVNKELNIKFRGILKKGNYYKGLPFEFVFEVLVYHFTENLLGSCALALTDNYDIINFQFEIGQFMGVCHYYDLELCEYFDNFDDKIITIQGQTEEYEEEIDTDREGVASSMVYAANDKLKHELLITKQEFQRLKISNYIYKKSVEKRFEELMRQGQQALVHVPAAVAPVVPAVLVEPVIPVPAVLVEPVPAAVVPVVPAVEPVPAAVVEPVPAASVVPVVPEVEPIQVVAPEVEHAIPIPVSPTE